MQSQLPSEINKKLRQSQTPWEAKLWKHLRGRRFYGFKFKRQLSVGRFVFDFGCDEKRILIELDGAGHTDLNTKSQDKIKENYAKAENYEVLRFWNNEVDTNLEGVLITIKNNLEKVSVNNSKEETPLILHENIRGSDYYQ